MSTTKSPAPTKPRDILKRRASEYLPEIQRRFGRKSFSPKHLGDGGAGVVYRVGPTKVVKVMLGNTKYKKVQHYKRMFKQLTRQTDRALQGAYEQFYVHSTFHTSRELNRTTKAPHFVYELMEYMPSDLKGFSKQDRWTGTEFKSILCQVMHGLHLFHRIGYVITDLKVDNVLINPVTGQIKLNDFCESYNTHTRSSCMYTYRNFGNPHSTREDVWRLGLLIVEFLHPRVQHLVKAHRLQPPEKDYVRSIRGRLKLKQHYNYSAMIAPYIAYQKRVLLTHDAGANRDMWTQLFPWLVRMLDNDPKRRPSLHQLLTSRVFCEACFAPRTNYRGAFGARYVASEPQASSGKPNGSRRGSSPAREASLHTPNTASSRASLPVPSTTATTPATPTSSTRRTTSDYGRRRKRRRRRHRRRTHNTATPESSNRHAVVSSLPRARTRRARKHRSWTISSKVTTATTATSTNARAGRYRRHRTRRWKS